MAALLALAAAAPAHAQACGTKTGGAPTLTAGQTVRGALAREDFTLAGDRYNGTDACTGRPYDSFFYEAQAGERLTFVIESRQIDPSITATTQWRGGGTKDVVEQRGRRGQTLTATGTVPAAGRILIQVESNVSLGRPGSTGDYTFTLRSDRPATPAPRPQADGGGSTIRSGQTVRGELTSRNGTLGDDSYFQDYTYQARRGETLVAGLTSDDFDAFLHVGRRGADGSLENRVSDDDGGGGSNSLVEYTADQNGPVTIRVNTLSAGETGSFSLEVYSTGGGESAASEPEQPASSTPALRAGQPVRGSLARGDGTLDDGSWYDTYTYTARRGERIVVRMESDEFDTVLGVSAARENADDLVMDDDGGGGTNSRVEYTATADGPILIRANALSAGDGGSYTIVLESGRRSALPAADGAERVAAAPATATFAASSTRLSALPAAFTAHVGPGTSAARALQAPGLPGGRRAAAASGAGGWLTLVAVGAGLIYGGSKLEDGPAEPLGALIRYTGYAVIAFAPFGG
ncbi:hypothetical protein [Longimicrobium sp.]|uniref:hypothetical protein n=1 Tax=Longimicrobium sp. TaxID=2029185 RepID=UPI003B3B1BAA